MFFVTGTDTGCGKTTVGRALLAAMVHRGIRPGVLKPVETGCTVAADGTLIPEDARALAEAAGLDPSFGTLCPYRLRMPASPMRAAQDEGLVIDPAVLSGALKRLRQDHHVAVIEGAGGLLVPLAPGYTTAELIGELELPAVVVARDALGTVNHTLLTLEALRTRHIPVLGVIFCTTDETDSSLRNDLAVSAFGATEVLGTLPFLPGAPDRALAHALEQSLGANVELLMGSR